MGVRTRNPLISQPPTARMGNDLLTMNGECYLTLTDAANRLGVSTKAVTGYLARGILPPPPTVQWGARIVNVYPESYLTDARERLARHALGAKGRGARS